MDKKIVVNNIKKAKPNLQKNLKDFLIREEKEEEERFKRQYAYGYGQGFPPVGDDWEDYWDGDVCVGPNRFTHAPIVTPIVNRHREKADDDWERTKRILGSGFGARDLNSFEFDDAYEYEDDEDDIDDDNDKMIYYYPDYSYKDDFIEFDSVSKFKAYLDEEGIYVSNFELESLRYRTVSHCAINPLDKAEKGELTLVTDHSYGALYYTCCEFDYAK